MNNFSVIQKKIFLSLDTYERHNFVKHLMGKGKKQILDVGGASQILSNFLRETKVISINLNTQGDIQYNGLNLPFKDLAFDTVVSLDVLEHIPKNNREQFINELIRVAQNEVLISTPLGSLMHNLTEKKLNSLWVKKFGLNHQELREHIANGLLTFSEIEKITKNRWNIEYHFRGDFRLYSILFRVKMKLLTLAKILRNPSIMLFNALSLIFLPFVMRSNSLTQWTNRIYIRINKI